MSTTLNYYNQNALQFCQNTISVEFTATQLRFLSYLSPAAHILDFGCGSGRDTKAFLDQGCQVEAIDGSIELCKLASRYTGIQVRHMLFQELFAVSEYDGIWACSSILHLTRDELLEVMRKMVTALKPGGIIYTSFKYGTFSGERNGRFFYGYDGGGVCGLYEQNGKITNRRRMGNFRCPSGERRGKMAQFDLTQNIEFEAGQEAQLHIENVEPTDVMTGDRNRKRFLYYQ